MERSHEVCFFFLGARDVECVSSVSIILSDFPFCFINLFTGVSN